MRVPSLWGDRSLPTIRVRLISLVWVVARYYVLALVRIWLRFSGNQPNWALTSRILIPPVVVRARRRLREELLMSVLERLILLNQSVKLSPERVFPWVQRVLRWRGSRVMLRHYVLLGLNILFGREQIAWSQWHYLRRWLMRLISEGCCFRSQLRYVAREVGAVRETSVKESIASWVVTLLALQIRPIFA